MSTLFLLSMQSAPPITQAMESTIFEKNNKNKHLISIPTKPLEEKLANWPYSTTRNNKKGDSIQLEERAQQKIAISLKDYKDC